LTFCIMLYIIKHYDREPYTFHTHSKTTSYMYKEFEHLLLWLTVIWMQPNIISYSKMYYSSLPAPPLVGESLGFSLVICCVICCVLLLRHLIQFVLIGVLFCTHISRLSAPATVASGHKDAALA
jgi:hypothetical protein